MKNQNNKNQQNQRRKAMKKPIKTTKNQTTSKNQGKIPIANQNKKTK
jgi:hypothetical protein